MEIISEYKTTEVSLQRYIFYAVNLKWEYFVFLLNRFKVRCVIVPAAVGDFPYEKYDMFFSKFALVIDPIIWSSNRQTVDDFEVSSSLFFHTIAASEEEEDNRQLRSRQQKQGGNFLPRTEIFRRCCSVVNDQLSPGNPLSSSLWTTNSECST